MQLTDNRRDAIKTLLNSLANLNQETNLDQNWAERVFKSTSDLYSQLLLAATSFGECRKAVPYAPLKPVIDAYGNFKWCCDHTPEHCA